MKKTIGGDRLGSGNKMKVDLHAYERSTFDLSYLWRSTMASGTLVPFMYKLGLPGDTWDINLNLEALTHPTKGPLFGSYKIEAHIFEAPLRLYQAMLHNNALNIGREMQNVKLPQIEMTTTVTPTPETLPDINNSQVNPSSLLHYLGIKGIGIQTAGEPETRQFFAGGILMYWDVYKNYFANKQEEIGAVLHTPSVPLVTTVTSITRSGPPSTEVIPLYPTVDNIELRAGDTLTVAYTGAVPDMSQIFLNLTSISPKSLEELSSYYYFDGVAVYVTFDYATWGTLLVNNWQYQSETLPTSGTPSVVTFPLVNLDSMRNDILTWFNTSTPYTINQINGGLGLAPYKYLYEKTDDVPNVLSSQEGLGLKTYQSDLFNNWISTDWIDGAGGINELTAISTAGDQFTLDQLLLSRKVFDILNRIAISGGSYNDWLDVVYDTERYQMTESPIYHGGLIKELVFQEVISNSTVETDDTGTQPLGTLAGRGVMSKKHKGGNVVIKVHEPSIIMGIVSITPRIDYSQGNDWIGGLRTMDDLKKPGMDAIGFQDSINEQRAWWSTRWNSSEWLQTSAGKVPAWLNYMTSVNEVHGNFAIETNQMYMTLNRRYEYSDAAAGIADLTTYIDPSKYNQIFAQTSLDSQNFWIQIANNITCRRKMSGKLMPNL